MAGKKKVKQDKRSAKALRTIRQRLNAVMAKAKRTERQVAKRYPKQAKALRARQAQAKKALAKLRRRSAAAAPPLKSGLQRAWSELSSATRKATARFRKTS
jgi:hypothetical protein